MEHNLNNISDDIANSLFISKRDSEYNGQSYKFERTDNFLFKQDNIISVEQEYTPWKLFRFYGGAKDVVNSFDCSIQSGDLSKIKANDYTKNKRTN
jgi:hypothetical protein